MPSFSPSLYRDEIGCDVFKFSISNVYFHVSQLDDVFSCSVFKNLIIVIDLQNVLNVQGQEELVRF